MSELNQASIPLERISRSTVPALDLRTRGVVKVVVPVMSSTMAALLRVLQDKLAAIPIASIVGLQDGLDSKATPADIKVAIDQLIGGAPSLLDTLAEIDAALNNDPSFATTVTTALAGKQPLDATLTALAALVTSADRLIYATGMDTFATTSLTAFARTLLGLSDAASTRAVLSVPSRDDAYFLALYASEAAL